MDKLSKDFHLFTLFVDKICWKTAEKVWGIFGWILDYEFVIDKDPQRPNAMISDWILCYYSECDAEDKAFWDGRMENFLWTVIVHCKLLGHEDV